MTDKAGIRRAVLSARRALGPGRRSALDAALVAAVASFVDGVAPSSVAAYRPLAAEPGGAGLVDMLAARTRTVLLPVLLPDRDLDWEPWSATGRARPWGAAAVAGVDLVIVPAVAVDLSGVRLGRGGGSYDRALARVPGGTPIVALLYDGELLDEVPTEPHDRRVTAVITPADGLRPLRPGGT